MCDETRDGGGSFLHASIAFDDNQVRTRRIGHLFEIILLKVLIGAKLDEPIAVGTDEPSGATRERRAKNPVA
ncbi:MAG: hypothetical protein H6905_01690 [Hyphomicrobiales bacterium]|nr:hypothetical protein [Hyphomicrobiales bacterium]